MFETLEGLSFMLLFKLKVHVTASFEISLLLSSSGTWQASAQDFRSSARHASGAPMREAETPLHNVWAKNRPTCANERSFVKKVRSWKSQTNNIRMFEHSLQLYKKERFCTCSSQILAVALWWYKKSIHIPRNLSAVPSHTGHPSKFDVLLTCV